MSFLDYTGLTRFKAKLDALFSGKLNTNLKGAANGLAELDANGKVPSSQLPSYVDDVIEYTSYDDFPFEGESGKIYVAKNTNLTYRWGGSEYVEISSSLALGETSSTAYRGDRGKAAYDHASAKGAAFSSGLYKIETNAEGHVTSTEAVTKSDITALGIPGSDTNTTYAFSNNAPTLAWNTTSTIGTVGGVALTVKMPANPDTNTTYAFSNSAPTLAWNTTSTIGTVGGVALTVKMPANPNTDHYAWGDITGKPATATRWPAWSEVTDKPNRAGSDSDGGPAQTIKGTYTGNGGQHNPNYFGMNKIGFLMMNTSVNSNAQYKDWIIMDCYSGGDVGGGVAFGVNRQSLGAYIMRSAAARTSWAESAELLGTHHLGFTASGKNYPVAMSGGKLYVNVPWTDNNTTYSFTDKNVTLAWGTTHTIATVGGTNIRLTMPANPNTNTTYAFSNNAPTLAWNTTSTVGTVGGVALTVKMPANPNTNTTYAFSNGNPTLAWNTTSTVGTAGGVAFTVKMPANPNTNTTYAFSNGNPTLAWGTTSTVGTAGGVAFTVKMPANPNTNTWRGIQNNLTSTSTTDSLSAAQGKILNDNKANTARLGWGKSLTLNEFSHGIILINNDQVLVVWFSSSTTIQVLGLRGAYRKTGTNSLTCGKTTADGTDYTITRSGAKLTITTAADSTITPIYKT